MRDLLLFERVLEPLEVGFIAVVDRLQIRVPRGRAASAIQRGVFELREYESFVYRTYV